MKKALFSCFTGILLIWTITSSYSQSADSAAKDSVSVLYNEISTKAVRNFIRDYKNVSNAKWFKSDNGFVVNFTCDGIKTRVFYTIKGDYKGMIRDYCEDKLSHEVRHLVKSSYYDFDIYHINEVTTQGITAYFVKLEDKNSWKTVKVVDGEMEVVEEFDKK